MGGCRRCFPLGALGRLRWLFGVGDRTTFWHGSTAFLPSDYHCQRQPRSVCSRTQHRRQPTVLAWFRSSSQRRLFFLNAKQWRLCRHFKRRSQLRRNRHLLPICQRGRRLKTPPRPVPHYNIQVLSRATGSMEALASQDLREQMIPNIKLIPTTGLSRGLHALLHKAYQCRCVCYPRVEARPGTLERHLDGRSRR